MASKALRKGSAYGLQILSAVVGLGISLYAFAQHLRLEQGVQDSSSFCSIASFLDCDKVNASPYSQIFGIPLGAVGALFYFVLLLLSVGSPPNGKEFTRFQKQAAWLCVAGLAVDFVLLGIQIVLLRNICILCVATYFATVGHLWANLKLSAVTPWTTALGDRLKSRVKSLDASSRPLIATMAIATLAFFVGLFIYPSFVRIRSLTYANLDNQLEHFFQQWRSMPIKSIPVGVTDGTFGNPNAKIQMVEFSDFECPHCRKTAFMLHTILPDLASDVFFVFKHYPLDSACNARVTTQMHIQACKLARFAVCAQRKGLFWPFHDLVFLNIPESVIHDGGEALSGAIDRVFPRDAQNRCLADDSSRQAVREAIDAGDRLMVSGTPALFMNGKPIAIPLTLGSLRRLIAIEMSLK